MYSHELCYLATLPRLAGGGLAASAPFARAAGAAAAAVLRVLPPLLRFAAAHSCSLKGGTASSSLKS